MRSLQHFSDRFHHQINIGKLRKSRDTFFSKGTLLIHVQQYTNILKMLYSDVYPSDNMMILLMNHANPVLYI